MLKGKNAIITGGIRGIGKGIALEFAKNGANLVICYRSNEEAAKATEEELKKFGTNVVMIKGDVSDPEFAKKVVSETTDRYGSIDILVNNAGITKDRLMMQMSVEEFTDVIDTNLSGSFYFMKAASSIMIKQKSGTIINLSSIVGYRGNTGQVNYSASKAGIIGMTLSAAKELGRRGITVNAIAPGFIETEMTGALPEEYRKKIMENIALRRVGTPKDIANVAVFLASDMGAYITGQVIGVDGGMSM